jgi:KaiC/GvpD/RAD55 family RecA-like ATPase
MILLTRARTDGTYTRVFRVEKMRRISHDAQPHPYAMAKGGIQVFPDEQVL